MWLYYHNYSNNSNNFIGKKGNFVALLTHAFMPFLGINEPTYRKIEDDFS